MKKMAAILRLIALGVPAQDFKECIDFLEKDDGVEK
jgi:hypothetical protein